MPVTFWHPPPVLTRGPFISRSTEFLAESLSRLGWSVRITATLRELGPPLLVGVLAAWAMVGIDGLDPTNIGWASIGDPATHYLGWLFFRASPWSIPLGSNPNYGLELGSAICYSDSIPLLALLFKPFARWLPQHFQYLGLWTVLCLILQAWFAWGLLGRHEATRSRSLRFFATLLFVFAPPLINRIVGHTALVAQWTVLAAVYLYLRPEKTGYCRGWPLLALVVSLVHAYLLVMVLAIWCADLASRRATFRPSAKAIGLEVSVVLGVSVLALWQAGFFMIQAYGSAGGYGAYGMNLLALITPDVYSHVLQGVSRELNGFNEGFNFLGLGALILVPAILPAVIQQPKLLRVSSRHVPLAVVLALMALFAISNVVHVGTLTFTIPLPEALIEKANILRSSGRMFWPAFYVILAWLITLLAKGHGPRVASVVLAVACLIQVIDTSQPWKEVREIFGNRASTWATPLRAAFWDEARAVYSRIRLVPLVQSPPDYATWAFYAGSHGMATDAAYLARVDPSAYERAAERTELAVRSGEFERDTLYVMAKSHASLSRRTMGPLDVLVKADGYYALAPGWRERRELRENLGE